MSKRPSALIADDEPLLRNSLADLLAEIWPELEIVAMVRNGREAVERFEHLCPDICFLDVKMPGLSGIDVAQVIGARSHLVFVTAFDQYAIAAFKQGALDYLLKPVEAVRLAETIARLKLRLLSAEPASNTEKLLQMLTTQLQHLSTPVPLTWIRAQVGSTLRLIAVDNIDFFHSDAKYTAVAWHDETGQCAEALIRTSLRELLERLDGTQFVQIHRSFAVNLRSVKHVKRSDHETADVHLKRRSDVLPVSRSYLHIFRQM